MPSQASYLYVVRMDVDPAQEFNRIYDEEHVPALLKVPGVLGAARYHPFGEC